MSDFESTSAEMQEVAEPAETEEVMETGVEDQEAAEPESETEEVEVEAEETESDSHKTEADASFAAMRRQMEEAQKEARDARAELERGQAQTEAKDDAFSRLTGNEDWEIKALAEVTGMSEDEIKAEMEAAEENAEKDLRIQQLEEQVGEIESERLMQADLEALRKIDPSLKSLEDLGPEYPEYIVAGLSPERAYWAIKAQERANQAEPPKAVGKVATGTVEKDYFTEAEIDAMSPEQQRKNYKKILASWERNK